ncbi:2-oxo acid dehydrogenase subunit E2 [Sciscionella sediminilitoris]|uniref:2-oxo acid dehydrogenase subunit E2 n=1 Tax=Sciscionella sediminilitoris TaxID=1445613 RepID=UPI0012E155E7
MSATPGPWPVLEVREKPRPVQLITAERLQRGRQTTVPATLMAEVEATGVIARRSQLADRGVRAGLTSIVTARLASTLARHPLVNCRIDGEERVMGRRRPRDRRAGRSVSGPSRAPKNFVPRTFPAHRSYR